MTKPRIVTAELLAQAWQDYMWLFGAEPHGTVQQMAALLQLVKKPEATDAD